MIETERRETGTLIGSDKVEGTGCVRCRQPEDWLDRAVMINKVSGHSHAMHEGSIGSLLRLIHTTLARPTAFPTIGPRLGAQPIALLLLGQTSRSIAPVNRFWRTQNALSSACSFRTAGASIVGMTGGTGGSLYLLLRHQAVLARSRVNPGAPFRSLVSFSVSLHLSSFFFVLTAANGTMTSFSSTPRNPPTPMIRPVTFPTCPQARHRSSRSFDSLGSQTFCL